MGQNNNTREHGDKQGQQGGQMNKPNAQEQQRQAQKSGLPDENIAEDKTANSSNKNDQKRGDHNAKN